MATAKFRGDSRRRGFFEHHLALKRFGVRQRDRIMSPGWSKVKEYVHLLSRDEDDPCHFEEWTTFAERDDVTVEIVQQAVERGRPVMAREPVKTIMFRLPETLKDALSDALKQRRRPREGIEKAVRKLLQDARKGADG